MDIFIKQKLILFNSLFIFLLLTNSSFANYKIDKFTVKNFINFIEIMQSTDNIALKNVQEKTIVSAINQYPVDEDGCISFFRNMYFNVANEDEKEVLKKIILSLDNVAVEEWVKISDKILAAYLANKFEYKKVEQLYLKNKEHLTPEEIIFSKSLQDQIRAAKKTNKNDVIFLKAYFLNMQEKISQSELLKDL